ncbi:MAG: flagellar hook-length control protein FliK, partial [Clostridia bacterium]|nr:flagellar hook-length control protein FliK [Clostridia bacterium]
MDVFAQSLKDARGTGTKAPDKKKDGTTDSKPQETGDAGKNQVPADQGKKSQSLEDGKYRDDSKKA